MTTYTHWDVLLASPTEPIPLKKRQYQLGVMKQALANFETAPQATEEDWQVLATVVDMMETLRDMDIVADPDNALNDAVAALGKTGMRALGGKNLRLDGPAIGLMRGIIEDYEIVCDALPARTMIAAHRITEKRLQGIIESELKKVAA